jgi:hypothetical protein
MNISDVLMEIDLEMLKEQATTLENVIENLANEIDMAEDFAGVEDQDISYLESLEVDKSNLEGLLTFLDNLIDSLEVL